MEFYKTRRKNIWLIVAGLLGVQILWALWMFTYMDSEDLKQGWFFCLYQFPMLNSILMPVITAVVASRLCDLEHKGHTLRLLNTIMPAGRLFDVKFLNGAVYVLAVTVSQMVMIVIAGYRIGFGGEIPVWMLGAYFFFTTAVSLTLLLLQEVLSLLFVNQMVPLCVGLMGAFTGLFSLFFPQEIHKFILWSYYGVLMFIRLDWDRETRISHFYQVPIDWPGFVILAVIFCMIYGVGRTLFVKKEL